MMGGRRTDDHLCPRRACQVPATVPCTCLRTAGLSKAGGTPSCVKKEVDSKIRTVKWRAMCFLFGCIQNARLLDSAILLLSKDGHLTFEHGESHQ